MKFYLSSYQVPTPNDLFALVDKPGKVPRVACITNAKDYYAPRARAFKVTKVSEYLKTLGLLVEEIDLRTYTHARQLSDDLRQYDLLWVTGGNTFCLRDAMHRSGFDTVIADVLESGVVYGGESAGAVITGPTIRDIALADEPAFAEEVINDGLGLIPYFILPHVGSGGFNGALEAIAERHVGDETMIQLRDSQALIVDDSIARVVEGA